MSSYILSLLPFGRKLKKKLLSPSDKIEVAQGKVTEAFIMFQQSHDAVMEANQELEAAVIENDKEINSIQANLNTKMLLKGKALDEIEANKKLAKKLEDFIK